MTNPTNVKARPTSMPTNKIFAATGGSGAGAALATIVLYFVDPQSKMPQTVTGAIAALITLVATFVAGYFMPPGEREDVITTGGHTVSARVS